MGSQAVCLYSAFEDKIGLLTLFLLVASNEGEKDIHIYLHVYNKISSNLKIIFNLF